MKVGDRVKVDRLGSKFENKIGTVARIFEELSDICTVEFSDGNKIHFRINSLKILAKPVRTPRIEKLIRLAWNYRMEMANNWFRYGDQSLKYALPKWEKKQNDPK
jgi:hypothetical protein